MRSVLILLVALSACTAGPKAVLRKAEALLQNAPDDFDAQDCFAVLKAVAQEVCPTVVSMVFDVDARTVYWCENREWDRIQTKKLA